MYGADPIGVETVGSLVAHNWNLELDSVEYAPIGYGSYHWHGRGSGLRWLVTADRDDERPVVPAYELTHQLGRRFGFVRSPLAQSGGDVVVQAGDWLVSVWPWVAGRSGSFGDEQLPGDVADVARCLRELHDHDEIAVVPALADGWDIPGRSALDRVLEHPPGDLGTGPYAVEIANRIVANRARLLTMVSRFDDLAKRVRDRAELVITHGEPHVANVVRTETGAVLIDWDTVRWAPRERDLWWLPGESWRDAYGSDQLVSDLAIEMYRLRWNLFDVADFVPTLLSASEPNPDHDVALEWVRRLLPV